MSPAFASPLDYQIEGSAPSGAVNPEPSRRTSPHDDDSHRIIDDAWKSATAV